MVATGRTHNVFAIASSAGGLEALTKIASNLPLDFPGSIFITQHTSPLNRRCYLADILRNRSNPKVHAACDNDKFKPSTIYVAPPDRHLLIRETRTQLALGPRENYTRPAADPMFRSAAVAKTEAGSSIAPSKEVLLELEYASSTKSDIAAEEVLGELSPYMCPYCDGQMWRSKVDAAPRFRCHVGHAHTMRSLGAAQLEVAEKSAWSTFRTLKEQARTYRQMADHERALQRPDTAEDYDRRAKIAEQRSTLIRDSFNS